MKSILEIEGCELLTNSSLSTINGGIGSQGCDGQLCPGEVLEDGSCDEDEGGN